MPALVIPNAALLRLVWTLSGVDTAVNVLGVVNTAHNPITQTLANLLDNAIKSRMSSTNLRSDLSTTVALRTVGIRDINVASQPEYLGVNAAQAGLAAGVLLPSNVAYCVTLRTALAGKRYRGRYYQWGFTVNANAAGGIPGGTIIADTVAFVNGINTDLVSNGLKLGVISRRGLFITDVVTATNRNTGWSTQRRRLIPGI